MAQLDSSFPVSPTIESPQGDHEVNKEMEEIKKQRRRSRIFTCPNYPSPQNTSIDGSHSVAEDEAGDGEKQFTSSKYPSSPLSDVFENEETFRYAERNSNLSNVTQGFVRENTVTTNSEDSNIKFSENIEKQISLDSKQIKTVCEETNKERCAFDKKNENFDHMSVASKELLEENRFTAYTESNNNSVDAPAFLNELSPNILPHLANPTSQDSLSFQEIKTANATDCAGNTVTETGHEATSTSLGLDLNVNPSKDVRDNARNQSVSEEIFTLPEVECFSEPAIEHKPDLQALPKKKKKNKKMQI